MSRRWALLGGGLAAVLAGAVAAFLAWGPVGMGPGPLSVAYLSSSGTVPQVEPATVLVPIATPAGTHAVINSVGIVGGGGYGPPLLISVAGNTDEACTGIWISGRNSFLRRCEAHGSVPLEDRALPRLPAGLVSTGLASTGTAAQAGNGIDVVLTVGPPGLNSCWGITKVTVHYTVGGRHYTAAGTESLMGCASGVQPAT
jgi:hypothetical protein